MCQLPCDGHPYIPNSAPDVRRRMLEAVGVDDVDELYDAIPDHLRLQRPLDLPEPFSSEISLRRHVQALLNRNVGCDEALSFLGGGCWQHYVPAVCGEINSRAEFLTAYGGDTYADLGKFQAIFEYQSMLGELVGMDVVSAPTYDWVSAASSALMMAVRITGRREILLAGTVNPQLVTHLRNFARPWARVSRLRYDPDTGLLDLDDLAAQLSTDVAAVYVENPSFLGFLEARSPEIAEFAHARGALFVVGVDPSSLGVLAPPSDYGADIVCGDVQPLGNHMHFGGGLCGFIATRDDPIFLREYPTHLVSIVPAAGGGFGFGRALMERTSYERRETASDFIGSSQWLWAITAGVYLALMGPAGMRELGEGMMQRVTYAERLLAAVSGVRSPRFDAAHFKEFVVSFDGSGRTVAAVNDALAERGIFGGHDLSRSFPELGQCALYCVTDVHTRADIDRLAAALAEVVA